MWGEVMKSSVSIYCLRCHRLLYLKVNGEVLTNERIVWNSLGQSFCAKCYEECKKENEELLRCDNQGAREVEEESQETVGGVSVMDTALAESLESIIHLLNPCQSCRWNESHVSNPTGLTHCDICIFNPEHIAYWEDKNCMETKR